MSVNFIDYLKTYLEFEEISLREFAQNLEINYTQLSQVMNNTRDLSDDLIHRITLITPFTREEITKINDNYKLEQRIVNTISENNDTIDDYIKRYQYTKLEQYDNSISFLNLNNKLQIVKDIMKYLRISNPYINKNSTIFYKSNCSNVETLNIWLEKCYRKTKEQVLSIYDKKNSIDSIVRYIIESSIQFKFDENELIKIFNNNGVYLAIVDDLPGSKIRGAFKVQSTSPAIYLTTKHKRIADIYFALLHEIGHLKSDFNKAKSTSLVSLIDEQSSELDEIERCADAKALNWMVNDKDYNKIKEDLNLISNYDNKSFIVYRLARDKVISYNSDLYQQYNKIITE